MVANCCKKISKKTFISKISGSKTHRRFFRHAVKTMDFLLTPAKIFCCEIKLGRKKITDCTHGLVNTYAIKFEGLKVVIFVPRVIYDFFAGLAKTLYPIRLIVCIPISHSFVSLKRCIKISLSSLLDNLYVLLVRLVYKSP